MKIIRENKTKKIHSYTLQAQFTLSIMTVFGIINHFPKYILPFFFERLLFLFFRTQQARKDTGLSPQPIIVGPWALF